MTTDSSNAKILLVDDDELVLKTLQLLVASFGYETVQARSGEEAVEILKGTSFDLVLSDLVMPNMNGLELLAYAQKHFPETGVIIATGYSEEASYADVIKHGATDFIKKPIDTAELEAKLARALRERKMVRELEMLSIHDHLTQLRNRRSFDETLSHEIMRAHRQGYRLFLAMIDIDNFKTYNDTYGHPEGDEVLAVLGQIMHECTRESVDSSFRLGGDEFAVLLPHTNASQATEIVQRILLKFVEKNFDTTSLSIGLTLCRRDETISLQDDINRIKKRADEVLYEAKKSGKNCVICRI